MKSFMKKNYALLALIGALMLVVYNVLVFAIAGVKDHTASFWVSYVMMMLGAALSALSAIIFSRSTTVMRDWFLGVPILRHTVIYVVLQLIVSILFMLLEKKVEWVLPFVVQFVLMAVFAILVISCFFTKNLIHGIREEVKQKTTAMALLHADAQMLCEICADTEAKKQFSALAEAIYYSDPMSHDLLLPLEGEIQSRLTNAKMQLNAGDVEGALASCAQASLLLKERNLKCMALK